jgi:sugar/nucleoside kinase (ribokinase family)
MNDRPADERGEPEPNEAIPLVVVIGAACRDVARDDRRGWRLGGGVTYSALTVARLGLRTAALVGADDEASSAAELDLLRLAGVDVRVVRLERGPVFENIETPEGRIQIAGSPSDPLPVAAMPPEWRRSPAWLFGPVADELPDAWADAPPADAIVGLGWQGLLRTLVAGERVRHRSPTRSPLVERADVVGVSRDDLGPDAVVADLCRLMRSGATLVLTEGELGGMAMRAGPAGAERMHQYPAIPPSAIVDRTGAGDVFLAALMAARVEPRLVGGLLDRHYDLKLGAAVASLVLEREGLLGVPDRAAVRARMMASATRA